MQFGHTGIKCFVNYQFVEKSDNEVCIKNFLNEIIDMWLTEKVPGLKWALLGSRLQMDAGNDTTADRRKRKRNNKIANCCEW
jgi:hypothetical protein